MEPVNVGRKKRSFGRTLLIFLLGVLVLILLSVGLPSLLPDRMVTANNQIALVEVSGMILDSRDIVRQLTQYSRDASIQGIILRVDSPGGSVGPSQEIYDAVRKIQESDKKIYASLGSVAASGGYYIASPTDRIFANPGTLTGSIGVIMAFSNIQKLIDKLGIRPEVIKSGEFKDAGSPVRPMTPEERNLLQTVVDDVHAQFIEAVARGRELPAEEVEKLATGRLFTGRQALDMKMIDQLGGLQDAVDRLAEDVGIVGRPQLVQERRSVGFVEWLLQGSLQEHLPQSVGPVPTLQYLWTGP